jgi:hypothetical protein
MNASSIILIIKEAAPVARKVLAWIKARRKRRAK